MVEAPYNDAEMIVDANINVMWVKHDANSKQRLLPSGPKCIFVDFYHFLS